MTLFFPKTKGFPKGKNLLETTIKFPDDINGLEKIQVGCLRSL